jgi:RND family efflux transporter MFP subunit
LRNAQLKGEFDRADAAYKRAKKEFDSISGLYEKGFVSRNAHEEAAHAHDTARLTFEQASEADAARTLTSPIAGTVSFRDLRFGEAVTAGRPVFRVVDLGALKVEVNLPEKDLARIQTGQVARIRSEVLEGVEVTGHVQRISPVVDPASGTIKITVALDPSQRVLRPGMFISVDIVTATHEGALLLSKRALVYESSEPFVFVVDGEKASRKAIKLGFAERDRVEVLSGIDEGARVVVVGQSLLRDGAEVKVTE